MTWYSLLGIAVGAWVAASLAAALLLGLLVARLKAISHRGPAIPAPVILLDPPRGGRVGASAGRPRATG